jgi:hypothetical protein
MGGSKDTLKCLGQIHVGYANPISEKLFRFLVLDEPLHERRILRVQPARMQFFHKLNILIAGRGFDTLLLRT